MNIIVAVNSSQYLERFNKLGATHIMISDEFFSSSPKGLKKEEVFALIDEIHNFDMKAIVRVDRLYDQKELELLTSYLKDLTINGVDGVLYSDITIKVIIESLSLNIESFYAPETLLTNSYDVKVLKEDGFNGCVISKDIPLNDVYQIVNDNPDYCYLRVFGPVLISYSARRFISVYTQNEKEYVDGYYLKEESRDNMLPIVEKQTGSWVYGFCLEATNSLKDIYNQPFKGLIVDNILYSDEYIVDVMKVYNSLLSSKIDANDALKALIELDKKIELVSIDEIKKTGLDKA